MKVFTLSLDQIKRNIFTQYRDASLCVPVQAMLNSLDELQTIMMALRRKDSEEIINYFREGNSRLAFTDEMLYEVENCEEPVLIIKDEHGKTLFAISSNQIKFA